MKGVGYTIFIFLLFTKSLLASPVEFILSSKDVAKGEPLIIEARVSGMASPKPTKKVFTSGNVKAIYSGVMTETKIINFNSSTYTTLRFSIIQTTPGRYKIPPIAINLDGKVHTIPDTFFTVTNKTLSNPNNSIPNQFSRFHRQQEFVNKDDLLIRFQTSKTSIYMGEPIIGYYILYSKKNSTVNFERNPNSSISFPFFTSELLNGVQISYPEEIRLDSSVLYHTKAYNREIFALTPLKKGSFSIGSTKFDIIQPMSFRFESETLNVEPQEITVKELPPNPPNSFTGEVGEYAMNIDYEGTETTQGNPWSFQITVKGSGLCNRIKDPVIDIVPESFPGKIVSLGVDRERKFSEFSKGQFGFQCEAKFNYVANLSSNTQPFYSELTFFNPDQGEYITKKVTIPSIKVLPASTKNVEDSDSFNFSESGPIVPWKTIFFWTGIGAILVLGYGYYNRKIYPLLKQKNQYLEKLDALAGNKTGLILEKALAKSFSPEEAKFWRTISEKYTNKKFTKIYSLLDYKERETFETWLKKGEQET